MKIDRHSPRALIQRVKLTYPTARRGKPPYRQRYRTCFEIRLGVAVLIVTMTGMAAMPRQGFAQEHAPVGRTTEAREIDSGPQAPASSTIQDHSSPPADPQQESSQSSDPRAVGLLHQVLSSLVYGPAFHAKVRETVWTNGREVVGVGTYEQAGEGTGRFNLQVTMHDGDGKHRLQQISDGRLAWTRTEIADQVSLRRVDVGRLDEWVGKSAKATDIAPRLTVGAWAELLTTFERDHVLTVAGAKLQGEPVWVLTGRLREDRKAQILADSGRSDWPMLYPARVQIAVRLKPDPATGFGELLPIRFEFWSQPITAAQTEGSSQTIREGRLITLIELYTIQPTTPPPAERFRFENHDAEVNFVNETDRYIQFFGVHLTERELRQLRR